MANSVVYLIGGAPGAGKTTLSRALGIHLGCPSLTGDDILTAVRGVTTPETHPDLHRIAAGGHLSYFTNTTVEDLEADALAQHGAIWPALERVARKRSRIGQTTAIDYWGLSPDRVATFDEPNITSAWIHIGADVLTERETKNTDFLEGSTDKERMFENFMARSLWWNERILEQATDLGLTVLRQDGTRSVDDFIAEVLRSAT